jgi:hypothetical protein
VELADELEPLPDDAHRDDPDRELEEDERRDWHLS